MFLTRYNLGGSLQKGGPSFLHVAGYESKAGQNALLNAGYGRNTVKFGPNITVNKDILLVGDEVRIFRTERAVLVVSQKAGGAVLDAIILRVLVETGVLRYYLAWRKH